jgi:predicted RNA binding protein YcfA (HicA-like mRNA interferase family)
MHDMSRAMLSSRDLIRRLERDGWTLQRVSGDHHIFTKPGGRRPIVVPHPRQTLGKGLVRALFRQAGWDWPPR